MRGWAICRNLALGCVREVGGVQSMDDDDPLAVALPRGVYSVLIRTGGAVIRLTNRLEPPCCVARAVGLGEQRLAG